MRALAPGSAAGVRESTCFALVFGIDCLVIDRQFRSRLAWIAVMFQGGGSQHEHKAHYAQSGTCSIPDPGASARRTGIAPELIFLSFRGGGFEKPHENNPIFRFLFRQEGTAMNSHSNHYLNTVGFWLLACFITLASLYATPSMAQSCNRDGTGTPCPAGSTCKTVCSTSAEPPWWCLWCKRPETLCGDECVQCRPKGATVNDASDCCSHQTSGGDRTETRNCVFGWNWMPGWLCSTNVSYTEKKCN